MEVFFIRALQLILCFSLLILLHEGGHFLAAKLFKIRVEKFCLFFDPWFSLFKFKPKHSDTTYALGWLPLGGYVKIAGMIDESMDTEQMKQPVQPWEFRAKPAWQRLIVMLAGVFVNFILALFIYAMVLFVWGDSYLPIKNMTNGFYYNEEAVELGFQQGDIPLRTEKRTFDRYDDNVFRSISEAHQITVLRHGKEVTFSLPGKINLLDMLSKQPPFLAPLAVNVIDSVVAGTPAAKAGIQAGDKITSVNGKPISTWNEYQTELSIIKDQLDVNPTDSLRLCHLQLTVAHPAGRTDTLSLDLKNDLMLGVTWNPYDGYQLKDVSYGFFASIPAGIAKGWDKMTGYVDDLKYLFTKKGAQSVGSFGAIGSLFPTSWNWERFWELTAFISLMLAFMNVLPIPALDGGHAFFLLCEVITGHKPSDKFMIRAETIGITLLLLLMAFAIFNDFMRYVF